MLSVVNDFGEISQLFYECGNSVSKELVRLTHETYDALHSCDVCCIHVELLSLIFCIKQIWKD
jgi:hypothetical protein